MCTTQHYFILGPLFDPTHFPTRHPSPEPSNQPTTQPTFIPTRIPSNLPTTTDPTNFPSPNPTPRPTDKPSQSPIFRNILIFFWNQISKTVYFLESYTVGDEIKLDWSPNRGGKESQGKASFFHLLFQIVDKKIPNIVCKCIFAPKITEKSMCLCVHIMQKMKKNIKNGIAI